MKQCLIASLRETEKRLYAKIIKHISVCSTRSVLTASHFEGKTHETTEKGEPSEHYSKELFLAHFQKGYSQGGYFYSRTQIPHFGFL